MLRIRGAAPISTKVNSSSILENIPKFCGNLNKAIRRMEAEVSSLAASAVQNITDQEKGNSIQAQVAGQRALLGRLQGLKASGRIALEMDPVNPQLPAITLEDGDQTADDFHYARKLMERHGALADTVDRANHYGDIARDALAIFPQSNLKDALLEAVDFCVARAY